MKASHKKRTARIGFQEIELEPGQFIYGRKKASAELLISERSARTCLKSLIKTQNVTIKTTNKFSIITIVNWATYQTEESKTTNKTTNNRPTSDQQVTTDKNVKNVKNERIKEPIINKYILPDWIDKELWSEYKKMRLKIKKPMTDYAEKLAAKELEKLMAAGDGQDKIVKQSIQNSWQGLFPVKKNGMNQKAPNRVTTDTSKYGED